MERTQGIPTVREHSDLIGRVRSVQWRTVVLGECNGYSTLYYTGTQRRIQCWGSTARAAL